MLPIRSSPKVTNRSVKLRKLPHWAYVVAKRRLCRYRSYCSNLKCKVRRRSWLIWVTMRSVAMSISMKNRPRRSVSTFSQDKGSIRDDAVLRDLLGSDEVGRLPGNAPLSLYAPVFEERLDQIELRTPPHLHLQ